MGCRKLNIRNHFQLIDNNYIKYRKGGSITDGNLTQSSRRLA
jgi:hypothetical protein